MNLDAENRVILNVGGIRHETYKVTEQYKLNLQIQLITLSLILQPL